MRERVTFAAAAKERNVMRAGAILTGSVALSMPTCDLPPLKWPTVSYGFALKEDCNAEEELQAGRDRRQAAAG